MDLTVRPRHKGQLSYLSSVAISPNYNLYLYSRSCDQQPIRTLVLSDLHPVAGLAAMLLLYSNPGLLPGKLQDS